MIANPPISVESPPARGEYPRPRLVRSTWASLNGPWEFQFDPENSGLDEAFYLRTAFGSEIEVPFAYQTARSGIGDTLVCEVVWYGKTFFIPEDWAGSSVLLHFGAVDYDATVWVNGQAVGFNRGGYSPFTLDVTRLLVSGANRICVRVLDSQDPGQPRGKQSSSGLPHGIDYWCTTGIWQSVWLEPVGTCYVAEVLVTSDIEAGMLLVSPVLHGRRTGVDVEVTVFDGEKVVARKLAPSSRLSQPMALALPEPRLWAPNHPHLYGLEIKLTRGGEVVDVVSSYAGLRSVAVKNGSFELNGEAIYLKMVLDQGYWPESGLTAPSDAALEQDVLVTKRLGFNAARKHQKVEDPRWLYWCDVHGLLIWGEMANARSWSRQTQERLEAEWTRAVERDRSHPCIIAWVPLNESMGFPNLEAGDALQRAGVERLAHLTRRLDPTRPVIDNDGWEQTDATDVVAVHDYSHSGANLRARYDGYLGGQAFPDRIWTGSRISLLSGVKLACRPIMLTEVGGFLTIPANQEKLDVMYNIYGSIKSSGELLDKYRELMNAIGSLPFLAGFCYTQLTDVEQEQNGLLTFDRQPKSDVEAIADIHANMR